MPNQYVSLWNWEITWRNHPSEAQQGKRITNMETPRKLRSVGIISILQYKTTTSALSTNLSVCLKVMFPVQNIFVPTWQPVFSHHQLPLLLFIWCQRKNIWTEYSDNVRLQEKNGQESDRQRNVCLTDVCSALLFSVWWFGAEQSSLWPPHHSAQLSVNTLNTHTDRQSQTLRQVIVYAHEARSCIFRNAIQFKLLLLTTTWEL